MRAKFRKDEHGNKERDRERERECRNAGNGSRFGADGVLVRDRRAVGGDIAERLLDLSVGVVTIVERLEDRALTRHIGLQVVRAATSAGANYQEARHAESRADFVHKVGVAAKELAEALYWLRLLNKLGWLGDDALAREADELIAILVASARTARSRTT
jgi:four helix bundle protein